MLNMLDFLPDRDGFAFSNNDWTFDQTEIETIDKLIQAAITPVIGLLSPFLVPAEGVLDFFGSLVGIPPGTLEAIGLGLTVTGELNNAINSITDLDHQHYGLCGGMAYAAADYYNADLIPPRGFHDHPEVAPGALNVARRDAARLHVAAADRQLHDWQRGAPHAGVDDDPGDGSPPRSAEEIRS